MGPRDRHSILRFIAFCQNNILCAAIFSESELGADVAPEQFHVGEGRQEAQNKDGCFRCDGWPGKKSRGPVPCPLQWHLLPLLFPCGSAFAGFTFKGTPRTEAGWGAPSSGALLQPGKDPGCLAGASVGGRHLGRAGPCHVVRACVSIQCAHARPPDFPQSMVSPSCHLPREAGRSRLHRAKGQDRLRAERMPSLALNASSTV